MEARLQAVMPHDDSGSVRVLLFAALRDQAGWEEKRMPLAVDGPQTALQLWMALELGALPAAVRVAVNQELVDPDQQLHAGDELAFLPPFTGG